MALADRVKLEIPISRTFVYYRHRHWMESPHPEPPISIVHREIAHGPSINLWGFVRLAKMSASKLKEIVCRPPEKALTTISTATTL